MWVEDGANVVQTIYNNFALAKVICWVMYESDQGPLLAISDGRPHHDLSTHLSEGRDQVFHSVFFHREPGGPLSTLPLTTLYTRIIREDNTAPIGVYVGVGGTTLGAW